MFPEPIVILGIPIHLFGIFVALSIAIGYLVTYGEIRRLGIPTDFLPDLAFSVLVTAFLGARLLFILERLPVYVSDPFQILKFWKGGISLYGGFLGGLFGGYLFCQRRKLSFALLSDPVALGLCLGLAVSRLGCFAAGCCYGKPTSLPWGVVFSHPLAQVRPLHVPLHPTQIYSFIAGMSIFAFLWARRKSKSFQGEVLLTYLLLESVSRILIEFVRAGNHLITTLLASLIFTFALIQLIQKSVANTASASTT